MSTATSSRMTSTMTSTISTISPNSPFPQNAVFPQNAFQNTFTQNTFPQNSFSQNTFPQNTFPQNSYPQNSYPQNSYPQNSFPQNSFPQNSYPQNTFPQNSFSSQISPYPQIPRNSPFQHQYHPSARQVQEHSSPSSSVSSASESFSLGSLPPSFDRSHLVDDIPVTYILEKLHLLGPTFYNDKQTAYAELHINSLPNTIFYVHKEYLILQSIFFRQVFERVKIGDCITITLPFAPETFQPMLEYLYTGDENKWYGTMTKENWSYINKNVQFLGLCDEAKAVCRKFYENEIEPTSRDGTENVCAIVATTS